MTTPTQAQVEAAAEKIWEDFSARLGGEWKHLRDNAVIKVQCMATAKAALTAAAQVVEQDADRIINSTGARLYVLENENERLRDELAATIERCAQVADQYKGAIARAIAAAIRKLKDEAHTAAQ